MKEYLIAFQYRIQMENWKWAKMIWRGKMTGANIRRIEDEIAKTLNADFVKIITFSELEQADD